MKKPITFLTLLFVICLPSLAPFPSISQDELDEIPLPFAVARSHWKASDESAAEIWLVLRSDGGIEMRGRDAASSYEGLVIRGQTPGVYHCRGRGFRFVGGAAFVYQSTLTEVEKDGSKALSEVWEATMVTGETASGESLLFLVPGAE